MIAVTFIALLQRAVDKRTIKPVRKRIRMIKPHTRKRGLHRRIAGTQSFHQQPDERQRRTRCVAQEFKRRDQPLLDLGEIAAERKRWQQSSRSRGAQRGGDARRRIVTMRCGNLIIARQFSGVDRLPHQLVLEAGVRDVEHRRDHFGIGLCRAGPPHRIR